MTAPADGYGSDRAFLVALKDRVKTQTAARGRTFAQIEREFLLQRFLARVFCDPDAGWVLKGGTAMLVRTPAALAAEAACRRLVLPTELRARPRRNGQAASARRPVRRGAPRHTASSTAHSALSETAWGPARRDRRGGGMGPRRGSWQ